MNEKDSQFDEEFVGVFGSTKRIDKARWVSKQNRKPEMGLDAEAKALDGSRSTGCCWRGRRRWRSEMEREARVEGEIGDGGWRWGWGWDRRWRVRRGLWIGDGGISEGFWSEMEGDDYGFRSERWGVREEVEVDRAQRRMIGLISGLRKTKEKRKTKGFWARGFEKNWHRS